MKAGPDSIDGGLEIDGDAFTEEVAVCLRRVFCFEAERFPVEGVGPREVEAITSQDSCGLDGLFELPVGEAGGSRQGSEVGVGVFGGAVGFGFYEGFSPVFEVRVGLGWDSEINESRTEFSS